jgi:hypothetical protein
MDKQEIINAIREVEITFTFKMDDNTLRLPPLQAEKIYKKLQTLGIYVMYENDKACFDCRRILVCESTDCFKRFKYKPLSEVD